MKVVIIGGGWAGVSAAITASKAGAEVHLYEKTDLLLGLGNVGGIMRNNGRFTAAEELKALGLEGNYVEHGKNMFPVDVNGVPFSTTLFARRCSANAVF